MHFHTTFYFILTLTHFPLANPHHHFQPGPQCRSHNDGQKTQHLRLCSGVGRQLIGGAKGRGKKETSVPNSSRASEQCSSLLRNGRHVCLDKKDVFSPFYFWRLMTLQTHSDACDPRHHTAAPSRDTERVCVLCHLWG